MKVPIVARVGSVSKEQGCSLGWLGMPSLMNGIKYLNLSSVVASLHTYIAFMCFSSSRCTNPLEHFLKEFLRSFQENHLHCTWGSCVCSALTLPCFQRVPFDSSEPVSALLKGAVMLPCFGKASF